jgi:hypothetical protein
MLDADGFPLQLQWVKSALFDTRASQLDLLNALHARTGVVFFFGFFFLDKS